MRKLLRGFCLLSVLTVVTTGCSQTSSSGTGTLNVGVRDDMVGFGYLNPDTNEYYGLEIDLARELATDLGYADVSFTAVTPETREEALSSGTVDCLIAMYSIGELRLERFDFSPAYYTDSTSVLVEASSMIDSLDDLVGKTVGVLEGANSARKLETYMKEQGYISDSDLKGTALETKDTYDALSDALEVGEVDAVCTDGGIAKGYMKDDRVLLPESVGEENYGVATQKGSELSGKVSQAVQQMIDDGTLDSLIDKWN